MASMNDLGLFQNSCGGCNKPIKSYAKDKQGTLPVVYCNRACETTAANKKRFQKNITYMYPKFN